MKPLDKYKFNNKIKEISKFAWFGLIGSLKIILFLFIIITAIVFWNDITLRLYYDMGIDVTRPVGKMFLIVTISTILILVDIILKLPNHETIKKTNKKR